MRFQTQAKIVAWIEIISSAVILGLMLLGMFMLFANPQEFERELERQRPIDDVHQREDYNAFVNGNAWIKLLYLTPALSYLAAEIALGVVLLKAAESLNYKKLRLWYVVTITVTVVLGIMMTPFLFLTHNGLTVVFCLTSLLFTLYSLWVVHELRREIKENTLPGHSSPPPVYQASFTNSNYYPGNGPDDKEFLKI